MRGLTQFILFGPGLLGAVSAQYFPPTPENVTVVRSQLQNGVSISYKEVRTPCPLIRGSGSRHLLIPSLAAAGHLRDDTRGKILRGICSPSTRHPRRCWRNPKLQYQHVLLVFRIAQGSSECAAVDMDEWWTRFFINDWIALRKWLVTPVPMPDVNGL
jgi:hypothetical protein